MNVTILAICVGFVRNFGCRVQDSVRCGCALKVYHAHHHVATKRTDSKHMRRMGSRMHDYILPRVFGRGPLVENEVRQVRVAMRPFTSHALLEYVERHDHLAQQISPLVECQWSPLERLFKKRPQVAAQIKRHHQRTHVSSFVLRPITDAERHGRVGRNLWHVRGYDV